MKQILTLALALLFLSTPALAQEPEQWSRFRGPNGQGISSATGLPTHWSDTENIVWKTSIPGEGWSSPVIWNDHIFLTTATAGGVECRVIAVDRKSGEILWNTMVFTQELKQRNPRNSRATPTPVTDGQRVYALFPNGSFVALDFAGNIVWINDDLDFYSAHGLAASPMLYGDLLITAINLSCPVEINPGYHASWDGSYLLALDATTGVERWRTPRGMSRIGHSTPVVLHVDGKDQILSSAGDVIQGFEPETGELIWTVRSPGGPAVPTPAIGERMIFASTLPPGGPILGIRTGGRGDVTETHVVWKQGRASPMTSSYLYVKPILYSTHENGTFSAHDEMTGEILWQHRLAGGRPDASPIYANGKVYLTTHEGVTTVLRLNENPRQPPEVVAINDIGAMVQATLAVAGNQFFLRTENELWCIGVELVVVNDK